MVNSAVHDSVVVGVDDSDPSDRAVAWAAHHANRAGRQLVVLHAGVKGQEAWSAELVAAAADVASQAVPRCHPKTVVALGSPEEVLVEAGRQAYLVVVGARGLSPVDSLLLGSVSLSLVGQLPCPVVVVRPTPEPGDATARPVVVGVDGTPASATAVEFAYRQASYDSVPLWVTHSTWTPLPFDDDTQTGEAADHAAAQRLAVAETIAGLSEEYPDVQVAFRYGTGDPAQVLADLSPQASLIVVGSHGQKKVSSSALGSVARRTVERSVAPVAVVRPNPA